MKTVKYLFFLSAVFAISAGFFACSDTKDDPPAISLLPGLSFKYPEASLTKVDKYEQIKFNFTATKNATSNKSLKIIKMVATFTQGGVTDPFMDTTDFSTANKDKITIDYSYVVKPNVKYGQILTITVSVEDVDGKISSKAFSFTITDQGDVNHYDSLYMGAQNNSTYGSYFASETGSVWLKGTAISNKTKVDLIYFFNDGTGDANCIAAPFATQIYDNLSSQPLVQGWTPSEKNKTEFKFVYMNDAQEFDRIRMSDSIIKKYQGGSTSYYIKTITGGGGVSNSYIAFKTVKGKHGIMRINDIIGPDPLDQTKNYINVSIKVQK